MRSSAKKEVPASAAMTSPMKDVAIEEVKELPQALPMVEAAKESHMNQAIKSVSIGRSLRSSVAKVQATPSIE